MRTATLLWSALLVLAGCAAPNQGHLVLLPETQATSQGQLLLTGPVFQRLTIVSGGEAGAQRAALDVALALALPCRGWCPKGRTAEDGVLDGRYPLQETDSENRTAPMELNVLDSDATLALAWGPPDDRVSQTIALAKKHGRPLLVLDMTQRRIDKETFRQWIVQNRISVLNIAGPCESGRDGVYARAREALLFLVCDFKRL